MVASALKEPKAATNQRRPATDDEIRAAALRCVDDLPMSLGMGKVAAILTGSRAKWVEPSGADQLDVHGAVDATQEHIRDVIGDMIDEGLLQKSGNSRYPVLTLTHVGRGEMEVLGAQLAQPETSATDEPRTEPSAIPPEDSSLRVLPSEGMASPLDSMLRQLLEGEPDEAEQIVPRLRVFHSREIAERLASSFDTSESKRVRARAVWAAGELCGPYGLPFLLGCAGSNERDFRRIAASALGKAARTARAEAGNIAECVAQAQEVLAKLSQDADGPVSQHAQRALDQLSSETTSDR